MSANHMIIGLGGTGGRVLRSFRKLIFNEFGSADPVIAGNLRMGYLYVDSSDEMMKFDDPTWKVLGSSVQLSASSQLLIKGETNLKARFDNLAGYPGIAPWIGSAAQWRDILSSTVGDLLGGQKRRLGRFLFACKAEKFREMLQSQVARLETGGVSGCTFHVCCGLAGGTGSGSIVDALCLIRDTYRNERNYRVRVYAFLPEEHPNANWDTGNYRANGYAALTELNALATGNWIPHDVTGRQHRLGKGPDEAGRYVPEQLRSPFTGCYVYTNVNQNNVQLDVGQELPQLVADFLFQKIVFTRAMGDGEDAQNFERADNVENRTDTVEVMEGSRMPVRSKQFLSFGMKRILIPEDEIHEYLAFNFAHNGALQLLFNNWREDFGYMDEPKPADFRELVARPESQDKWRMSDEHLTLSRGILDGDVDNKQWKPLSLEWSTLATPFKEVAKQKEPNQWIDGLEKMYQDRFAETYRRLGVAKFYETKDAARKEMAKAIRLRIEQYLIDGLMNGSLSLTESVKLLDAIIENTRTRGDQFNTRRQKELEREPAEQQEVMRHKASWAAAGVITRKLRGVAFVDAMAVSMEKLMTTRTKVRSLEFATVMAKTLVTELEDLKSEVQRFTTTVSESSKSFKERASAKCNDSGDLNFSNSIVRFYDPTVVRQINAEFKIDLRRQQAQTNAIRTTLTSLLGAGPTFQRVNQNLNRERFVEVLEEQCGRSAKDAHEAVAMENRNRRVMGVNIIEKLAERYGGDVDQLKRFVRELVEKSGLFMKFNEDQVALSGVPTVPVSAPATEMLMVLRPNPEEHRAFVQRLDEQFRQFSGGCQVIFVDIDQPGQAGKVAEELGLKVKPRTNVIAVVRLATCFPLRYVGQVKMLKEKFTQRVMGTDPARAKLEVLLEGDGEQHNDLFVRGLNEEINRILPKLLIGWAGGMVRFNDSAKVYEIPVCDADGLELPPLTLGKDLGSTVEKLNFSTCEKIDTEVAKLLSQKYKTSEKRAELKPLVVNAANTFKAERGSYDDPVAARVTDAARKALAVLNG